jgi:hypothetical protein
VATSSATQNLNKLYSANFKFEITRAPVFSEFAQSVTVPSITLGEAVQGTPLIDVPIPGDKLIYGELSVDFIVDEEIRGWMEIHKWMRSAGFPESTEEYEKLIYCDATLVLLSNIGNPLIKVTFYDCYPTSIGDISLNTQTSSDTVISNASFRFRSYDIEPIASWVDDYENINLTLPTTS